MWSVQYVKTMSHEAICPCNLQCNFCWNKYCRLQFNSHLRRTQLVCDLQWDYILRPPSIWKCQRHSDYVVLWLVPSQKIARQVAAGVSHAATCRVALRKVDAASPFSATCNAIFRCETSCKHGVSHEEVFLATCNATPLRCKENCLVWHGLNLWNILNSEIISLLFNNQIMSSKFLWSDTCS